MVKELEVRYAENISENKIASEIYKVLEDHNFHPIEIVSNYLPRIKIFTIKYFFSKKNNPEHWLIERVFNNTGLLKKVEIL